MNWTIAEARQHFSQLLKETENQPQNIYKRDQWVATIVDAETYEAFQLWQESQKDSITKSLSHLAQLCQEEDYQLELPKRSNRPNPFS